MNFLKRNIGTVLLLLIAAALFALLCSCDRKTDKHVDIAGANKTIFLNKYQLSGYKVVDKIPLSWGNGSEPALRYYLVISNPEDGKQGRKKIRVTENLYINCDIGESFPVVVEKENR